MWISPRSLYGCRASPESFTTEIQSRPGLLEMAVSLSSSVPFIKEKRWIINSKITFQKPYKLGVEAPDFNPSILEVEAGWSLWVRSSLYSKSVPCELKLLQRWSQYQKQNNKRLLIKNNWIFWSVYEYEDTTNITSLSINSPTF